MPQTKTDDDRQTFTASAIKLDAAGNLPTRFALFVTGDWKNSIKGDFKVDLDHLKQMKSNFDNGIGFPTEDATTGLAIDFAHNYADEAAGWIKGLELQIDPADDTKGTLFASPVEWTEAGAQAIQSGKFKCVSPMGAFGEKNGKPSLWSNPTNLKEKIANVLEGAGLTNIPFLREMAPIRADRAGHLTQDSDTVIYVYDLKQKPIKEPRKMNIDELRLKKRDELTVPELDFLSADAQRSQLSKDELAEFKLDAEPEKNEDQDDLSEEDKQTLAAIKDGSKKLVDSAVEPVEKDRFTRMESTIERYRKDDVRSTLDKHVKRGAIKHDQAKLDGFWAKQLLGATTEDEEKVVKDALDALPENEQLAKEELGTGEDTAAGSTAREQLDALAREKVAAAAKEGKELLYTDALKQVYREKSDLRTQDSQEQKQKVGA